MVGHTGHRAAGRTVVGHMEAQAAGFASMVPWTDSAWTAQVTGAASRAESPESEAHRVENYSASPGGSASGAGGVICSCARRVPTPTIE